MAIKWLDRRYVVNHPDGSAWGTEASTAWTPIELMEASLGLCVAKSLNLAMAQDGIEADRFDVSVSSAKATSGAPRLANMELKVELPELFDPDYRDKLLQHASRICTIGNTLKKGSEIEYESA
ncbi:OsmC family protein [Cohnella nanjingensis]|uniref:OsmC family protein n=1 Tax=Cohnella nanjingensis TaxID=1387779 RepID=A0A7X0S0F7_9BACL|nr:OsmC family protein [Cohnella nanjingensis]MBB6675660.1 OsmC family protein [Cohnella nanjingensis]